MKRLIFFLFLFYCMTFQVFASPFKPGETITYNIKQLGMKAGSATLTFVGEVDVEGKEAYQIIFEADGFNFYDKETIYVDQIDWKPIKVERDLDIFGSKEFIVEHYLRDQGKIEITKTVEDKTETIVIEKEGAIDNIYALLYRYRLHGKFVDEENLSMTLPTADVDLKVEKKVNFKALGQSLEALYLKSEPSKYKLWFDTSSQRLPLRIGGAIGFGNTMMTITEYKE